MSSAQNIMSETDNVFGLKISNGKHEGLNNKIRTMTRRSYGFHSPEATLALSMLACGPVTTRLLYQK